MKLIEKEQPVAATPFREPKCAHIPALDGLRGIAVMAVLVFHFTKYGHGLPPPSILVDKVFLRLIGAGWAGVDLFFVLSGFLITGILYDSKQGDHYLRNFYARRCLRIFPLYYVALTLFLVILPGLFPAHDGLGAMKGSGLWYWTYLSNVLLAGAGWPWFGAIGHFWSLAVEEQFYLIWPCIILLFKRRTLLWVCLAFIVGAPLVRTGLWFGGYPIASLVLTPARMDALALGALVALAGRGPAGFSRFAPLARKAAIVSGAAVALTFVWRRGLFADDVVVATIGFTILATFFASVVVLAVVSTPASTLGRLLTTQSLTFFGRYSYALYVFHHPLLFFMPAGLAFSRIPELFGSQLPAQLLFIVLAGLVSVALALGSWHLCERQFLKLKRFFPYQFREHEVQ